MSALCLSLGVIVGFDAPITYLGLLGGFGAAFLWQRAKGARVAAAGGAPQRLALSEADADAEEEQSDGDEGAEARASTPSSRVKMVMKDGARLD